MVYDNDRGIDQISSIEQLLSERSNDQNYSYLIIVVKIVIISISALLSADDYQKLQF